MGNFLMRYRWFLLMSALLASPASAQTAPTKVLTVCEALSNLDQYRGKIIAIRGVVSTGHHGSVLSDDRGPEPCPSLLEKGLRWPPAMVLTWPERSIPEDGPRQFVPDAEQINRALAEVRKAVSESLKRNDYSLRFIATVVGELRSRKDIIILWDQEQDWYAGTGYGQGGQYPADLVVQSVADPKLVNLK
jgi:hypothetical protein